MNPFMFIYKGNKLLLRLQIFFQLQSCKSSARLFLPSPRLFLLACPGILSRDSAWLAWIRPNKYAGICSGFIRCQNRIRQSMHQKQPIHHTLILSGCKENQSKCYIKTDKYMNNSKSGGQSKITAEISNKYAGYFLHLEQKYLYYFGTIEPCATFP